MSYEIIYFNQRVRDGIHAWPVNLKARYFALTLRMKEFGPNLGMPHTRPMGGGLFEVRAKSPAGIGRAFFCTLVGRRIVILHGFIKTTLKTPGREMQLARERMEQVKRHEKN